MRKKIGEVLVAANLIDAEQLGNALTIQKGKNKRLGKVLVELGYVDEVQVAQALAKQLSLPLVDCKKYTITKDALATVPKEVAERRIVMPLQRDDKNLLLAMANPLDWELHKDIAFKTGLKVSVAVSPETPLLNAIEHHYGSVEQVWDLVKEMPQYSGVEFLAVEEDTESADVPYLSALSEAPPVVKLVTMMFADAVVQRASDVHIEPEEKYVQVRYRIDGDLTNKLKFPKQLQDSVITRIKIISNLDITNRRLPQDSRTTLRLEKKKVELRISTLPSFYGEKVVARILDPGTGLASLGALGIPDGIFKQLINIIGRSQGMFLVTGPTGSGKTTTLYAMLRQLQSEKENIVTLENPIEYKLPGITQVGVNEAIGLTFATTLRSVLRQDPDIIFVGEIRDLETAEIAARSSLTGHFVLSTVHTTNTVSTITRLIDIGIQRFLVAATLSAILSQRLVKKICPACRAEVPRPEDAIISGFPPLETCYKGTGCKECNYTGYRGRIGIYEFLPIDAECRRMISRKASEGELWEHAVKSGVSSLFDDGWEKVRQGLTTIEEVISNVPYES